jgi:hypothetical protein
MEPGGPHTARPGRRAGGLRQEGFAAAVEAQELPALGGGVEVELAVFVARSAGLIEPQAGAGGEAAELAWKLPKQVSSSQVRSSN